MEISKIRGWETEDGDFIVWGTHDVTVAGPALFEELDKEGMLWGYTGDFAAEFAAEAVPYWTANTPNEEEWEHPIFTYDNRQPGTQPILIWSP